MFQRIILKPGQIKKDHNFFQLHRFLNTFETAEKKYSKNSAAGNFFGPSYFVTALAVWIANWQYSDKFIVYMS